MRAAKPSDSLPPSRTPGIDHNNPPPDTTSPPLPLEGRLGCSINEAAKALGLQRDSIYRMITDGRLTGSKMGRRTIVHVASIHRLLAETVIAPRPRVRRDTKPKPATDQPAAPPARRRHHRTGKAVQVQAATTTP
jgi:excisionase family DNA binding protein